MKRLLAPLVLVVAVVVALVLTLGGGTESSAEPGAPNLTIPRVGGGDDFPLASVNGAERPTLLWFWAPWCPICNQEAPNVETLADDLDVIAIGGRDQAASGPAFVDQHGLTTPTVVFDEAMASWEHYRIVGQPGAVLLDREGRERARWSGPMDNAEVLAAARAL